MISGSENAEGTPKRTSSRDGEPASSSGGAGAPAGGSATGAVRVNGNGAYGGRGGSDRGDRGDRPYGDRGGFNRDRDDRPKPQAMEVYVENNIEKAMKVLKRKLIKEGLFKELKSRRYYEKPSERKKRKEKDSIKKARKEEARQKKNPFLFS